jgi:hypothetical protein
MDVGGQRHAQASVLLEERQEQQPGWDPGPV